MKYKVGDKVEVTSLTLNFFEVGDIVEIVYVWEIEGSYDCKRKDGLCQKLKENQVKGLSEIWKRDDIITDGDDFVRILGVCGEAIFASITVDSAEEAKTCFKVDRNNIYAQKELEEYGWHLYTEPSKEETIDLLGQTYKKEEIEKALKNVKPIN